MKNYREPEQIDYTLFQELRESLADFRSSPDCEILLTDILKPKDCRFSTPAVSEAKKKEIANLLTRGTFEVVLREEIPEDANVLRGRFVLAIKSIEDSEVKFKARRVIGGHRDRFNECMLHSSRTLQPASSDSYWPLLRYRVSTFRQQTLGRPTCRLPSACCKIYLSKSRYQNLNYMPHNACGS